MRIGDILGNHNIDNLFKDGETNQGAQRRDQITEGKLKAVTSQKSRKQYFMNETERQPHR